MKYFITLFLQVLFCWSLFAQDFTALPFNPSVCVGESVVLAIQVEDDGFDEDYTWTSDNPSDPTVSSLNTINGPIVTASPTITTIYTCTINDYTGIFLENVLITVEVLNNPTVSVSGITAATNYCSDNGILNITSLPAPIPADGNGFYTFASTNLSAGDIGTAFTDNCDGTASVDPAAVVISSSPASFELTYNYYEEGEPRQAADFGEITSTNSTVTYSIPTTPGEEYTFYIYDNIGNGISPAGSVDAVQLVECQEGLSGSFNETIFTNSGGFGISTSHTFTASSCGNITSPSSCASNLGGNFLEITINTDAFPAETAWELIHSGGASCLEVVTIPFEISEAPTSMPTFTGLDAEYCTSQFPAVLTGNPIGENGVFNTNVPTGFTDNGDGTASLDPANIPAGTYTMSYTFANGGCVSTSPTSTFAINATPPNSLSIVPSSATICAGDSVLLYADWDDSVCPGPNEFIVGTYVWSPNASISGTPENRQSFVFAHPTTTTTYTVTAGGQTASVTVTVLPEPTLSLSGLNANYCNNENTFTVNANLSQGNFSLSPNASAGFTDNGNGTATLDPQLLTTGNYALTYDIVDPVQIYTYDFGQTSNSFTEQIAVEENMVYDFYIYDAFGDGLIEGGGSVVISACGNILEALVVPVVGGEEYSVEYFQITVPAGCSVLDVVVVTDNFPVDFGMALYDPTALCSGTVTENFTIATATDATFTGLLPAYCLGSPTSYLDAVFFGGTFTASPNVAGAIIDTGEGVFFEPNVYADGTTVTVTYEVTNNGCTSTSSQTTVISAVPTVSFTGLSPMICSADAAITLVGTPTGGTFTTTAPTGLTGNILDPSLVPTGTTFSIEYTYSNGGCEGSEVQTFVVTQTPILNFSGLLPEYCLGDPTSSISPSTFGGTFSVSPNVSGAIIDTGKDYIFDPNVFTMGATVEVTYEKTTNGCTGSFTQTTIVHPPATIVFTGLETGYCSSDAPDNFDVTPVGGTLTIAPNVSGALSFDGSIYTFDPSVYTVGTMVVFTYDYVDAFGCNNTFTETVSVSPTSAASFTGLSSDYCASDPVVTLLGAPADMNGVFNTTAPTGITDNGDGTATLNPALIPMGNYTVSYTYTNNGCSATSPVETFLINTPPNIITIVPSNHTICAGDSVVLFADWDETICVIPSEAIALNNFVWTPNSSLSPTEFRSSMVIAKPTTTTTYTVTAAGQTASVTVNVIPETTLTLSGLDAGYCSDEAAFTVTANLTQGNFSLSPGASAGFTDNGNGTATLNPQLLTAGTYALTYDIENPKEIYNYEFGQNNPLFTDQVAVEENKVYDFYVYDSFGDGFTSGSGGGFVEVNACGENLVSLISVSGGTEYSVAYFQITVPAGCFFLDITAQSDDYPTDLGMALYDPSASCSAAVTENFTISAAPVATFTGLDTDYCLGDDIDFIFPFNFGGTFTTTPNIAGAIVFDGEVYTFDPNVFTTGGPVSVTYEVTNNGCTTSSTQMTTVHLPPTLVFTGLETDYCTTSPPDVFDISPVGGTLTIDPNISGALSFDGSVYTFNPSVFSSTETVTFTYNYTDGFGCNSIVTQTATVSPTPLVSITGLATMYCADEMPFTISGTPNSPAGVFTTTLSNGFLDNGDGTATVTPSAIPTGNSFEITYAFNNGNGCEGVATAESIINELPTVSFTGLAPSYSTTDPPVTITGAPLTGGFTTTATAGLTDNENGTATLDPSTMPVGGPYEVTYALIDANGCVNSTTQQVTIVNQLLISFSGLSEQYCEDAGLVQLTGTPTDANGVFTTTSPTGLTDNGNGTATLDISLVPTDQTFSITYTYTGSGTGQSGISTQQLIVHPNPVVVIEGLDPTYCTDDATVFFTPNFLGGTMSISPNVPGALTNVSSGYTFEPGFYPNGETVTFTYNYTDGNGCNSIVTNTTTISPTTPVSLTGLANAYCADETPFTISGTPNSPAGSFTSSLSNGFLDNGDGTATVNPSEIPTGILFAITYTFTNANGCQSSATTESIINELPTVNFTGLAPNYSTVDPLVTITGTPTNGVFTTTATAGFTNNGNGTATIDPSMMPIGGPYNVTYTFTDANGCTNSSTQQVSIFNQLVVSFGGLSEQYCEDAGLIQLTGSPTNANGVFTTTSPTGLTDNGNGTATLDIGLVPTDEIFSITYTYTGSGIGQSGVSTQQFIVHPNPVVTLSGLAPSYCADDQAAFITTNFFGGTMSISPNVMGALTDVSSGYAFDPSFYPNGETVTFTYNYTDGNGCNSIVTQSTTIFPTPVVSITGLAATYCADEMPFTISGTPNSPAGSFTSTLSSGFMDNGDGTATLDPSMIPTGVLFTINYNFTSTNGCASTATEESIINEVPTVAFTGLAPNYPTTAPIVTLTGTPTNGIFTTTATAGFTDNGNGTATLDPSMMPVGGPYDVTYTFTNAEGCTNSTTQQVSIFTQVLVAFSGLSETYCENAGLVQLTGTPTNANGVFTTTSPTGLTDNGNGTATLDISLVPTDQTFSITYTYTGSGIGQSGVSTQQFIVHPNPVVVVTGLAATYCANDPTAFVTPNLFGGTMTISPNVAGALTDVSSGYAFDPSFYPNGETVIFTYNYTDGNGCNSIVTNTTTIFSTPNVSITALAAAYCSDEMPLTIAATPNLPEGTFTSTLSSGFLDNGNGTATLDPSLIPTEIPFTVTYSVTNANGCNSIVTETSTINPSPVVTVTGLATSYCANDPAAFITPNILGGTMTISPNVAGALTEESSGFSFDPSFYPNGETVTLTYNFTNSFGCNSIVTQTTTVFPIPNVSITGLATAYCSDEMPFTISATPNAPAGTFTSTLSSGFLDNGDGTATLDPSMISTGNPFTISYSFTNVNGCNSIVTQTSTINPSPVVTLSGLEPTYCADSPADLITPNFFNGTMTISPNVMGALTNVTTGYLFDPSFYPNGETVTFTYNYTSGLGCNNIVTQTTTIFSTPTASIAGLAAAYCADANAFTMTGIPNSPAGTFTTTLPSGFMDNGNGTATLGPNSIPTGTPFSITYTYINGNGCSAMITENLIINENPVVSFTGLNPLYCGTEEMSILVGSEVGGTFSTIPAGGIEIVDNQPTFNPTQFLNGGPVEVIYEFTNAEGCTGTASQFTNVVNAAVADFTPLEAFYCAHPAILVISGNPFPPSTTMASFETDLPNNAFIDNGDGTASINFGNATAGQGYFITYRIEDANGCSATQTQNFNFGEDAPVNFTNLDAIICSLTDPISLVGNPLPGANAQAEYSSSLIGNIGLADNGDGTGILNPALIPINFPFKIYYTYTDENNCTKVDSQSVLIGEEQLLSFTGIDGPTVCNNIDQLVLTPSLPGVGEWSTSPPGLVVANDTTAIVSLAGVPAGTVIKVTYALPTAGNCTESVSEIFEVLEAPSYTLADTLVVCQLGRISIEPLNPLDTILWSTGDTIPEITITGEGTYSVKVTAANGCMVEDSVAVLVESGLSFLSNFLVANSACTGDTIHFIDISNILVNATAYKWDFGDGSPISTERDPTHIYPQGGSYNVNFTAIADGCDSIDINKTINILGCLSLPPDEIFDTVLASPNPNRGDFKVEIGLNEKQPIQVTLFDFQGRKVEERNFDSDDSFLIEYQNLSKGFYSVVIQTLKERKAVKVLVFK